MDRLLIIAALLALPAAVIAAFVDAARRPLWAFEDARRSKGLTVLGILITGGVGAVYYWLYLRRVIVRAQRARPGAPS